MTIHQGVLYVTNSNPPQGVQSFDATTGANTGNFVPSLANPSPRDVRKQGWYRELDPLVENVGTVHVSLTIHPYVCLLVYGFDADHASCERDPDPRR
jgi:hypothetical protein